MSEHLIEMAKSIVRIKNGEIEVLTDPLIQSCPLRSDLYGCHEESRKTVDRVLKRHISELGMFGPERVLETHHQPVSFGASEIIMDAMTEGLVDAAVVVCEGAGTVVVTRPEVLQAVGAHMTGLLRTSPIKEIQQGLVDRGCLLLDDICTIDQIGGFVKARDSGFKKIVVTVTGNNAAEAKELWEMGRSRGIKPLIFAVHNTGISPESAGILAECCDIVWSCASRSVREIVGERSKIQIGISIPVFGVTQMGKRLILNRMLRFEDSLVVHRADLPFVPAEKQPKPLI